MYCALKAFFGLCICLLLAVCFSFDSVEADQVFMKIDIGIEDNHNLMDAKTIDDLLGPDTNFPFDPANHRDGSNPIKRIGKISDDNL